MNIKALFIGSIGVVTETSDYQRRAYNQAMSEHGLNWEWTPELYKELLQSSGGKKRLLTLSKSTNQPLNEEMIDKIHTRKTELACEMIEKDQLAPRPGVVSLIKAAKKAGAKVAWVTSTYPENTNSLIAASNGQLSKGDFDYIFHRTDTKHGKPSPSVYQTAMKRFELKAFECVAVEDSLTSILAAKAAGIFTVATLGEFHDEQVENIADLVLESLGETSWEKLVKQVASAPQMA